MRVKLIQKFRWENLPFKISAIGADEVLNSINDDEFDVIFYWII